MKYLLGTILATTLVLTLYGCDDGGGGDGDECDDYYCDRDCSRDGFDGGYCTGGNCRCTIPCTVPEGTYSCSWRDNGGDCYSEIVDAVLDVDCALTVSGGECGNFAFNEHGSDGTCDISMYYSGSANEYGIVSGEVILMVSCDGGAYTCEHDLGMRF